jgi:hypothetical protein
MSESRRGGRKPVANEVVKPTLSAGTVKCLEDLAKLGRFGSTKTEVAAYLIMRGIEDMSSKGMLPPPTWD